MSGGFAGDDAEPVYRPPQPKEDEAEAPAQGATMLDALFGGRQAREQFRTMVLEVSVPLRGRKWSPRPFGRAGQRK